MSTFIYYYHFFFLHREAFDGRQSSPAGLVCWGTRESTPPPRPQHLSLPQDGPPGKLIPMVFCFLWPESPSKGMQGAPFALSLGLVAAVALNYPPSGSHPAWKRGKM